MLDDGQQETKKAKLAADVTELKARKGKMGKEPPDLDARIKKASDVCFVVCRTGMAMLRVCHIQSEPTRTIHELSTP